MVGTTPYVIAKIITGVTVTDTILEPGLVTSLTVVAYDTTVI
jgi:hypothetical protein